MKQERIYTGETLKNGVAAIKEAREKKPCVLKEVCPKEVCPNIKIFYGTNSEQSIGNTR